MNNAELSLKESAPYKGSALLPLVHQEALALQCRDETVQGLHTWRHAKAVLLGSRDAALKGHQKGVQWLCEQGYEVAVRPFGGLAVALDEGVLNVTLFLPGATSIDEGFATVVELLRTTCRLVMRTDIQVGEIVGSYCPGRFDLSLHGVKFAGIAQRRLAGVNAVSAFVNVRKNVEREWAIQQYYEVCGAVSQTHSDTQDDLCVSSGKTASLEELNPGLPIAVSSFTSQIRSVAREMGYPAVDTMNPDRIAEAKRRLERGSIREWRSGARL